MRAKQGRSGSAAGPAASFSKECRHQCASLVVARAPLKCRLDSVRAVMGGSAGEDPLDNEEQLQDQLDSLPYLCRFQYEKTSDFLIAVMDPVIAGYQEAAKPGAPRSPDDVCHPVSPSWSSCVFPSVSCSPIFSVRWPRPCT